MRLVIIDGIVNKGLGAGLCALVDYAVANAADGDVLVVMDCDDTHDPEQIEEMLACIAEGADVVIGSRYERGALVRACRRFAASRRLAPQPCSRPFTMCAASGTIPAAIAPIGSVS